MGSLSSKPDVQGKSPNEFFDGFSDGSESPPLYYARSTDKLDPRSPTPDISRTPITDMSSTPAKITKNKNLTKEFELDNSLDVSCTDNPNSLLSAIVNSHLQNIDPRSPAFDFERTPLVLATKLSNDFEPNSLNKLKNDFNSPAVQRYPFDRANSVTCNHINGIIPRNIAKDLEQSMNGKIYGLVTDEVEIKLNDDSEIKKGLLETNFDYIETNLDKICLNPAVQHAKKLKILDDDPRSPTVGIDRTLILAPDDSPETGHDLNNYDEEDSKEALIAIQNMNNMNFKRTSTLDKKKETVLIYEDDSTVSPPDGVALRKVQPIMDIGSRTPLSCMKNKAISPALSNNEVDTKGKKKFQSKIPKLKSKIPRPMSVHEMDNHIPNIKHKPRALSSVLNRPVSEYCENTPPHSHRDNWDQNRSIVL